MKTYVLKTVVTLSQAVMPILLYVCLIPSAQQNSVYLTWVVLVNLNLAVTETHVPSIPVTPNWVVCISP